MPLNLESCTFLLTYKCVAKCRHCPYRASPDRKGVMKVDDLRNFMTTLFKEQQLEKVDFSGGEPFLFYKTLKRCIEIARKFARCEICVTTNGYWGGSQSNAQAKIRELKAAGLTSISFNVDFFHQECTPLRSVHNAIDVARAVGIDRITVISQFLGGFDLKNSYNVKTEEYLERLRLPESFKVERKPLVIEGRASDLLANYLKGRTGVSQGKCVLHSRKGGTLENPKTIELDHHGNISICPGLSIGNAKTESFSKLIREYDYRQHPIARLLAETGPHGLLKIPDLAKNIDQPKCVSICHLCYSLRRQLRGYCPEFLAPESCYKE